MLKILTKSVIFCVRKVRAVFRKYRQASHCPRHTNRISRTPESYLRLVSQARRIKNIFCVTWNTVLSTTSIYGIIKKERQRTDRHHDNMRQWFLLNILLFWCKKTEAELCLDQKQPLGSTVRLRSAAPFFIHIQNKIMRVLSDDITMLCVRFLGES